MANSLVLLGILAATLSMLALMATGSGPFIAVASYPIVGILTLMSGLMLLGWTTEQETDLE